MKNSDGKDIWPTTKEMLQILNQKLGHKTQFEIAYKDMEKAGLPILNERVLEIPSVAVNKVDRYLPNRERALLEQQAEREKREKTEERKQAEFNKLIENNPQLKKIISTWRLNVDSILDFSIIDLYLLFPEFKEAVKQFRAENNIKPKELREKRDRILGEDQAILDEARDYSKQGELFSISWWRGLGKSEEYTRSRTQQLRSTHKKLVKFEEKEVPDLAKKFESFLSNKFDLPSLTEEPIKNFLVYNEKIPHYSLRLLAVTKGGVRSKVDVEIDKDLLEPCVVLKIFGGSDTRNIGPAIKKEVPTLQKVAKLLPTPNPTFWLNQGKSNLAKQFIYILLRERESLTHRQTNSIMERIGLEGYTNNSRGREIIKEAKRRLGIKEFKGQTD